MAEIKLSKRYKFAGDIFPLLIEIGFDEETAESFLNKIPDADVVEVCRCKDCEYANENRECGNMIGCTLHRDLRKENDFCNYGTRKKP